MAQTKQLPTKHRTKKVSAEQEELINKIKDSKNCTWAEAKHEFFEALEQEKATQEPAATEKKKRLTVAETKLGVTMVLSHDDCKEMGYEDTMTTGEVYNVVMTSAVTLVDWRKLLEAFYDNGFTVKSAKISPSLAVAMKCSLIAWSEHKTENGMYGCAVYDDIEVTWPLYFERTDLRLYDGKVWQEGPL